MIRSLWTAVGLGAVSGLRSMQGLAWVSRELAAERRAERRARRRAGRRASCLANQPEEEVSRAERVLSHDRVAYALGLAAAGELAADKHPSIPSRIEPAPLLGRATAGAVLGSIAAGRDRQLLGAVAGGGCAVAVAWAGWFLRREAGRAQVPDLAVALAEDALAVALARRLARGP